MDTSEEKEFKVKPQRATKDFSEEDFLRDMLINLAADLNTPPDILTAEFSKIEEEDALILKVEALTEVSYSCNIGRDRDEEYIDIETSYNTQTKRNEDKLVKKVRTVVDWQPYSGTSTSNETVFVCQNSETVDDYGNDLLREAYACCNIESGSDEEEIIVNATALGVAKEIAVKKCYKKVRFPGDHIDCETVNGDIKIKKLSGLIVPEYYLGYLYKDNTYYAASFAGGKLKSRILIPEESEILKTDKLIANKTKSLTICGAVILILGILLAACSFFVSGIGLWFLIPLISGIVLLILDFSVVRGVMRSKILNDKKAQKREALIKLLQKTGLSPLNQKELNLFK